MTDKTTAAADVILKLAEETRLAQESDARTQAINTALSETLVQREAMIAQLQFSLAERDATIKAMQEAKAAEEAAELAEEAGEQADSDAKDRTISDLRAELESTKTALARAQVAPRPVARNALALPAPVQQRPPVPYDVVVTARDGNNRASKFRITPA